MKWFKHDSDANNDAKLRKLRLKYGMEGYGLYWFCLELIARNVDKNNLTFELEHDSEIIAADTCIHIERVQEMMAHMVSLGLFEGDRGSITCLKMALRLDETTSKNPKIKHLQDEIRNRSRSIPDSLPTISGNPPARTEQNRTEQNRTEKNICASSDAPDEFIRFWNAYPKKKNKGSAIKAWIKIKPSASLTNTIVLAVETAKKSRDWLKDGGQYIPHPATWLNARGWEDEVEIPASQHNQFEGAI